MKFISHVDLTGFSYEQLELLLQAVQGELGLRQRTLKCKQCGQEYLAKSLVSSYCSDRCKSRWYYASFTDEKLAAKLLRSKLLKRKRRAEAKAAKTATNQSASASPSRTDDTRP